MPVDSADLGGDSDDGDSSSGRDEPGTSVGLVSKESVRVIVVRWPDIDVTTTSTEKLKETNISKVVGTINTTATYLFGPSLPPPLSDWDVPVVADDGGGGPGCLSSTPAMIPQTTAVAANPPARTRNTQNRLHQDARSWAFQAV